MKKALSDICYYVSDKIPVKQVRLDDYVSTENLLQNRGGLSVASKLPPSGKVTAFQAGDALVSNIRPYFKKIWLADRSGGASNDVLVFRKLNDNICEKYLYYILADDRFFAFSTASASGSKMPRGDKSQIMNYPVKLPPLEVQKKITDILSSLDEKIELNRRMNETLEQLGQALFRHYFVDKTKQSNGNIQTIPLGKKFHLKRGRSLQARDMICGDTPVISGGLKPAGFHNEANTTAPVITISASGANAGFVSVWGEPVWSADSSYIDSTITKYVYTYYLFLKNKQKEIYDMQTGSGQPHIYPKHIELLEIADLSDCEFNGFEQRVRPLFDMIHENKKQIDYLSNIRDLLLPKLISGEIEV
ncbi:restriction endonuclease subunit S [TM7 phylum sp. oral taxon 348]|nr:restriction endonuclease subunit S [TM7 phylum sp. oral taxon 348]TWP19202.1 restriction endonuclease subunit S [TM7 phylum sp. oral taxon 348]